MFNYCCLTTSRHLAGIGELASFTYAVRIWPQDISVTRNELKRCLSLIRLRTTRRTGCTKPARLGRYLPDGNVEWAGRNDRRVNIRGFRIELEEVEAVLKQHPTVTEAAVIAR